MASDPKSPNGGISCIARNCGESIDECRRPQPADSLELVGKEPAAQVQIHHVHHALILFRRGFEAGRPIPSAWTARSGLRPRMNSAMSGPSDIARGGRHPEGPLPNVDHSMNSDAVCPRIRRVLRCPHKPMLTGPSRVFGRGVRVGVLLVTTALLLVPAIVRARQHLIPRDDIRDRKSTRLNSSHIQKSRMPSSA